MGLPEHKTKTHNRSADFDSNTGLDGARTTGQDQGQNGNVRDPDQRTALAQSDLLDTPETTAIHRAVRLALRLTRRPAGFLSLVDDHRQVIAAETEAEAHVAERSETQISEALCHQVEIGNAPLRITDAYHDPRVTEALASHALDIGAYLGVPVRSVNGQTLGALCVTDPGPVDWTDADLAGLQELAAMIGTELELRRTIDHRDLLIHEVNHRTKNVFTLVGVMVRQIARDSYDVDEMSADIQSRLQAFSAAFELIMPNHLMRIDGAPTTTVSDLLVPLLKPYPNARIHVSGVHQEIGQRTTISLALCFHELATNAAKYGAISESGGVIHVSWTVEDGQLLLTWREDLDRPLSGGALNAGFGSRLLHLNIEGQLGGRLSRQVTPRGIHVGICIPVQALAD